MLVGPRLRQRVKKICEEDQSYSGSQWALPAVTKEPWHPGMCCPSQSCKPQLWVISLGGDTATVPSSGKSISQPELAKNLQLTLL